MNIKRVKSGVKGLDKLMDGGFPDQIVIDIKGGPGVGKSIFGMQFLMEGVKNKEMGLYISLEQPPEGLKRQADQFGWKFTDKQLMILHVPDNLVDYKMITGLEITIKKYNVKRLVIDSLPALFINAPKKDDWGEDNEYPLNAAKFIYKLIGLLKKLNICTLVITEPPLEEGNYIPDPISDYLADGIVELAIQPIGGEEPRSIRIKKMRYSKINTDLHSFRFGKNGIEIIKN